MGRAVRGGRKRVVGPRLSRLQAPEGVTSADWQRGLRQQFGAEQAFTLENLGSEPFFSDFAVANPESKSRYRVAIRGRVLGDNYCSCPDFATNGLGTCKHIEFTLAKLCEQKRGGVGRPAQGFQPPTQRGLSAATASAARSASAPAATARRRCWLG